MSADLRNCHTNENGNVVRCIDKDGHWFVLVAADGRNHEDFLMYTQYPALLTGPAKEMWKQENGDYSFISQRQNTVLLDREQLTALRDSINKYLER